MRWIRNMAAGLIGSTALNILHEVVRKNISNAPQINLLGAEAVNKTLSEYGRPINDPDDLHKVTLELDLIGNAAYYSMIGGSGKYIWPKAIAMGLSAGIGALQLPKSLGLDPTPVNQTTQKQVLTVGYYLFGAVITALALKTILKP
jgi:hypothetical protein